MKIFNYLNYRINPIRLKRPAIKRFKKYVNKYGNHVTEIRAPWLVPKELIGRAYTSDWTYVIDNEK